MNRTLKIFLLVGLVSLPAILFIADNQHLVDNTTTQSRDGEEQAMARHGHLSNTSFWQKANK